MFEDSKCDDLYVMIQFIIEDPWITFDSVNGVTVGDKLKITGKTNLAASDETADETDTEDTLWLTIHRLDLNSVADTSTAMKIPVDNINHSSPTPFRGYRTFSYDDIDTSSWYLRNLRSNGHLQGRQLQTKLQLRTSLSGRKNLGGDNIAHSRPVTFRKSVSVCCGNISQNPDTSRHRMDTCPVSDDSPGFWHRNCHTWVLSGRSCNSHQEAVRDVV